MVKRVKEGEAYTCNVCHCRLEAAKGPDTQCDCNLTCCGQLMQLA